MSVRNEPATIDPDRFRALMGALAGHVAVITALDPERRRVGLTTTALTSVSAEPPLLLVCVDLTSRTLPALRDGRRFVINLMHDGSEAVAIRFASKLDNKFLDLAWSESPHGIPVLEEHSIGWLECRTEREIEAGDHAILIAEPETGGIAADEAGALLYHRRRFGSWTPLVARSGRA
jgi:flavin reductase (DIM6/NTAB) family NADH-FMN oxidoreductase RutF